jgi:vacuolar-type H+-ATPase subunit H
VDSLESARQAEVPSDSLAIPGRFEIPELIDFNMDLAMHRVLVDELTFRYLEGNLRVGEGVAHIDHLKAEVLKGTINLSGTADPREEYMKVDASVQLDGLDIPTAYEKVISVERLVPMARYCRGTANLTMHYSSLMDEKLTPVYGTIDAEGRVFTEGLQIYNLQGFVNINDLVRNEKIRRMAPDEVEIDFTIRNGRVQVAPFDVDFDDSRITVGGSHGIDHSLDYLVDMDIAKKDLGPGALSMVNSMTFMAKAAGLKVVESDFVNVKATITGTFEKPILKTDLSGNMGTGASVGEQLRNRAKEEIESIEEEVRGKASQRADQIIADAEAEAARIVNEARRKGDQLVQEAKLQGDQLIEDAGSNALRKMAAERAAKELVTQAQKQSDRMVEEAEKKAAEIVEKAREEASRL